MYSFRIKKQDIILEDQWRSWSHLSGRRAKFLRPSLFVFTILKSSTGSLCFTNREDCSS